MSDDVLIEEIAQMLVRIERNYARETSGPGSRFEGKRLEIVQAEAVLRRIRERHTDESFGFRLWAENKRLRQQLAEANGAEP